jgi:hypothetical protein
LLPVEAIGSDESEEVVEISSVPLPGRFAPNTPGPQTTIDQKPMGFLNESHAIVENERETAIANAAEYKRIGRKNESHGALVVKH